MKRKLISFGIIGFITALLIFAGIATGAISYRSEKDNINFGGHVKFTGVDVSLNSRVQKSWYTPNFKPGTGFTISGTTSQNSYFKIAADAATELGSALAPGSITSGKGNASGATVVLPTITSDMDGTEYTFVVSSGTTTVWFYPTTGTIQTTSGTTGLNIASQPNLTGDSVTFIAAYSSGVSWVVKNSFIQ